MKYGRVMTAAPKSGSGKTMITCGLLAWLRDRGIRTRSWKCGPDYIDPMFHRQVLGIPGGNLDTFFDDEEELRSRIASADCEAAVIEGVMGIYDGITGASAKGSCYEAAAVTETPVILIMDVKGMGNTMLSVLRGILADDEHMLIRGIILNRISGMYLKEMRPHIEKLLEEISSERGVSVELTGGIPNVKGIKLESRHLGLVMPDEITDLEEQVAAAKDLIEEHLDTEMILRIMSEAGLRVNETDHEGHAAGASACTTAGGTSGRSYDERQLEEMPVLAVARDEAFCFYYEENLQMIESCGIRIKEFSPIHDSCIPPEADGLLLGGGYPELHASELSANERMRDEICSALKGGMPSLAECGGFMYLMDEITGTDGIHYPMCGVIEGTAADTGRLGRFGYITVTGKISDGDSGRDGFGAAALISGLSIRGHEFHYYDSTNNGTDAVAVKPVSGRSWECIHTGEEHIWGFPHLYYPSCPELMSRFYEALKRFRDMRRAPDTEKR